MENLDQNFEDILLKSLEGMASHEEMELIWRWIEKDPENKKYYENMRDIWMRVSVFQPLEENQIHAFWERFKNKNELSVNIEKEEIITEPKRLLPRFIRVAAILIVTLMLGVVLGKFVFNKKEQVQVKDFYVIEAPRGAKSFVTLTDGTKIWLNAGSKISYQRNYNQENRNIFLEGEAFFEVAKNKEIPFLVYSSGIVVKAIGTAFNVKAYPEEGIVETTLVEGSVSIESIAKSGKREQTLMQPNQKANFYKVTQQIEIESREESTAVKEDKGVLPVMLKSKIERIEVNKEVDTELYTSWKDKRWVFEKQKMEDFSVILERLYDVKVVFKDEELKQYRISGSFEEEDLEQVLKAVQLTIPMEYSINHKEVIFGINKKMKNSYKRILKTMK